MEEFKLRFTKDFKAEFDRAGGTIASFDDESGKMTVTYQTGRTVVFGLVFEKASDLTGDDDKLVPGINCNIRQAELSLKDAEDRAKFDLKVDEDASLKEIRDSIVKSGVLMERWLIFCVLNKNKLKAIVAGRRRLAAALYWHLFCKKETDKSFFYWDGQSYWIPVFYMDGSATALLPQHMSQIFQFLFEAKNINSESLESGDAFLGSAVEVASNLLTLKLEFKVSDKVGGFFSQLFDAICGNLDPLKRSAEPYFACWTGHLHWVSKEVAESKRLQMKAAFCNYCLLLMALGMEYSKGGEEGDRLALLLKDQSPVVTLLKEFQKAGGGGKRAEGSLLFGEFMGRCLLAFALELVGKKYDIFETVRKKVKKTEMVSIALADVAQLYLDYIYNVYASEHFKSRTDQCLLKLNDILVADRKKQKARLRLMEGLMKVQFLRKNSVAIFDRLGALFPDILTCHVGLRNFDQFSGGEELKSDLECVFLSNVSQHPFLKYDGFNELKIVWQFPLSEAQVSSFVRICGRLENQASCGNSFEVLKASWKQPIGSLSLRTEAPSFTRVAVAEDPVEKAVQSSVDYAKVKFEKKVGVISMASLVRKAVVVVLTLTASFTTTDSINRAARETARFIARTLLKLTPAEEAACVAAAEKQASNGSVTDIINASAKAAASAATGMTDDKLALAGVVAAFFARSYGDDSSDAFVGAAVGAAVAFVAKELFFLDPEKTCVAVAKAASAAAVDNKYTAGCDAAFKTVESLNLAPVKAGIAYAAAVKALGSQDSVVVKAAGQMAARIARRNVCAIAESASLAGDAAFEVAQHFSLDPCLAAGLCAGEAMRSCGSNGVLVCAAAASAAAKAAAILFRGNSVEIASIAAVAAANAAVSAKKSDDQEKALIAQEKAFITAILEVMKDGSGADAGGADTSSAGAAAGVSAAGAADPSATDSSAIDSSAAIDAGAAAASAAKKIGWTSAKMAQMASRAAIAVEVASKRSFVSNNGKFSHLATISGTAALNAVGNTVSDPCSFLGVAVAAAAAECGLILERATLMMAGSLAATYTRDERKWESEQIITSIGSAVAVTWKVRNPKGGRDALLDNAGPIVAKVVSEITQLGNPILAAMRATIFLARLYKFDEEIKTVACAVGRVAVMAAREVDSSITNEQIIEFAGTGGYSIATEVEKSFVDETGYAVWAAIAKLSEGRKDRWQVFANAVFPILAERIIVSKQFDFAIRGLAIFFVTTAREELEMEGNPLMSTVAQLLMQVLVKCQGRPEVPQRWAESKMLIKLVGCGVSAAAKFYAEKLLPRALPPAEKAKWDPAEIISLGVSKALEIVDTCSLAEKIEIASHVANYAGCLVSDMARTNGNGSCIGAFGNHVYMGLEVAKIAVNAGLTKEVALKYGSDAAKLPAHHLRARDSRDMASEVNDEWKALFEEWLKKAKGGQSVEQSDVGVAAQASTSEKEAAAKKEAPAAPKISKKRTKRSAAAQPAAAAAQPAAAAAQPAAAAADVMKKGDEEDGQEREEKEKVSQIKSDTMFKTCTTKTLLPSPNVLFAAVSQDVLRRVFGNEKQEEEFVKAVTAKELPLLILDCKSAPNADIDLLLNALKRVPFAIAFPYVVDTRNRPELTSKVLVLSAPLILNNVSWKLVTIVSHTVFANAICASTLGGLGSIATEIRIWELYETTSKKEALEVVFLDEWWRYTIGVAALEPRKSFLFSKVIGNDNVLKLSEKMILSFSQELVQTEVDMGEIEQALQKNKNKYHFQPVLGLVAAKVIDDSVIIDDGDDRDDDDDDNVHRSKREKQEKVSFIFPRGGNDQVTLFESDLLLADEGRCLNDSVIAFYVKYMEEVIGKSDNYWRPKALILSSHLYPQLLMAAAEYEKVYRWLKTGWAEKDYIVFPINESLHWYLAVVDLKGCKIFFIDSLSSQRDYRSVAKNISDFLTWSFKKMGKHIGVFTVKVVKVPQQKNIFDCGVFLLHFLELFLFSSFLREEKDDYSDLFSVWEISEKRTELKRILLSVKEEEIFAENAVEKFRALYSASGRGAVVGEEEEVKAVVKRDREGEEEEAVEESLKKKKQSISQSISPENQFAWLEDSKLDRHIVSWAKHVEVQGTTLVCLAQLHDVCQERLHFFLEGVKLDTAHDFDVLVKLLHSALVEGDIDSFRKADVSTVVREIILDKIGQSISITEEIWKNALDLQTESFLAVIFDFVVKVVESKQIKQIREQFFAKKIRTFLDWEKMNKDLESGNIEEAQTKIYETFEQICKKLIDWEKEASSSFAKATSDWSGDEKVLGAKKVKKVPSKKRLREDEEEEEKEEEEGEEEEEGGEANKRPKDSQKDVQTQLPPPSPSPLDGL